MIDFTMPGHLAPVPQTWKQGRVQRTAAKGGCNENKLRLVRAPGETSCAGGKRATAT